jgi:uncharacterized membrane protein YfcA
MLLLDALPEGFLILVALAALGSFVFGVAGFGSGLVAIPLALHVQGPHLVLGVFALLDAVNVVRVLASQSIDPSGRQAVRREWLRLVPACAVGLAIGSWLLTRLTPRPLMAALGLFLIVYALSSLRTAGPPRAAGLHWAVPAGLGSGITSAMFGIGGPPYVIYLVRRGLDAASLRVAMAGTGLVSRGGRVVALAAIGLLDDPAVWLTAAVAAPASLLSLAMAERLRRRVPAVAVRRFIEWLLLLSGLSLLAKVAAGG